MGSSAAKLILFLSPPLPSPRSPSPKLPHSSFQTEFNSQPSRPNPCNRYSTLCFAAANFLCCTLLEPPESLLLRSSSAAGLGHHLGTLVASLRATRRSVCGACLVVNKPSWVATAPHKAPPPRLALKPKTQRRRRRDESQKKGHAYF
ncbi:hypothetical protein IF1G_09403 [Cordyceps javanica]|uniref:Uncharacterized protein n=1 Tax=Cordyceps javanica TaxID=43265 RepID=A0A545UQT4_9HYPO|nr:hypothetical protein IF1G_09403 [Cordyceps javanica]TQW03768.1 hypothetical protein IF2G_08597 [Cordyceps javanica]